MPTQLSEIRESFLLIDELVRSQGYPLDKEAWRILTAQLSICTSTPCPQYRKGNGCPVQGFDVKCPETPCVITQQG